MSAGEIGATLVYKSYGRCSEDRREQTGGITKNKGYYIVFKWCTCDGLLCFNKLVDSYSPTQVSVWLGLMWAIIWIYLLSGALDLLYYMNAREMFSIKGQLLCHVVCVT